MNHYSTQNDNNKQDNQRYKGKNNNRRNHSGNSQNQKYGNYEYSGFSSQPNDSRRSFIDNSFRDDSSAYDEGRHGNRSDSRYGNQYGQHRDHSGRASEYFDIEERRGGFGRSGRSVNGSESPNPYDDSYKDQRTSGGDYENERGWSRNEDSDYRYRGSQGSLNGDSGEKLSGGFGRGQIEGRQQHRQGSSDSNYSSRLGQNNYEFSGRDSSERGSDSSSSQSRNFYGKGPKGYKRSDERIQDEVSSQLMRDHRVDAEEISISVKDGIVTLSGAVEDKETKRLAEDICEEVLGVQDVQNNLRSSKAGSTSSSNSMKSHEKDSNGANRDKN